MLLELGLALTQMKGLPVAKFAAAPARPPQALVVERAGGVLGEDAFFDLLAAADIVYVGEKHDSAAKHRVQLLALQGLHKRRPGLAVGLEMASVDQQDALDDYSAGRLSDAQFAEFWAKEWGFDFKLYEPILSYAKANGLPLVALNAPRSIVSQTARGGLSSLTPEQRKLIPPDIRPIQDADYLRYVKQTLNGHGQLTLEREARMLEAMQAWNETMARSAAEAARRHGALFVIAGSGHMLYRSGIAECAPRYGAGAQAVVLPYPQDDESLPAEELLRRLRAGDLPLADYFWLLPEP